MKLSEEERTVVLKVLSEYVPRDEYGRATNLSQQTDEERRQVRVARDLRDRIRVET